MQCACCGKEVVVECVVTQPIWCNQECHAEYNARVGGGLSGKTNFASYLEAFIAALAELVLADRAMKQRIEGFNSPETDLTTIGNRYIRNGKAYTALRPKAVAVAEMMNKVRMPGKLRGSKTAGEALIAAINGNLITNWTLPLVQGKPVLADHFTQFAAAVAPFLNGDPRVEAVFLDISRALATFTNSKDTSPAVVNNNLKTLLSSVNSSGGSLDEIYAQLIASLKPEKTKK